MTETIGQMSPSELSEMIENIVEKKLLELLKDPDTEFELNEGVVERLLQQRELVGEGDRGLSLEAVRRQLLDE
ncbi:MAG: hypothetical protein KJ046_16310 [Anaerolineae bacterium]|nr:hypothetical protein [Anaerolineae bacterium]